MKKILMICMLVASGCFLSCGNAQEKQTKSGVVTESSVIKIENDRIIPTNGKPTVVDFSADWCGWCKKLEPIFDELKQEYGNKINFVTIDVDQYPDVSVQYRVNGIPNILFLDSTGKVLTQIEGYQPKDNLVKAINTYF